MWVVTHRSSFLHMSRLLARRVGHLPQRSTVTTAPRLITARTTTVPIRALAMTTRTNPTAALANKRLNVVATWLSAPKNQVNLDGPLPQEDSSCELTFPFLLFS